MSNFKLVAKNTIFLTFSEIIIKALGFFWVVFLAHFFTIVEYGRYNLVNSFIDIFSFLPDLGVGLIVIREIAKHKGRAAILLGNSFLLNTFLAFLTFLVIVFVLLFTGYSPSVNLLIIIASMTLFFSTIRSVGIFYFDGMETMSYSAFFNSLNTFLLILFALFFGFILHFGLTGIFIGMFFATLVSLALTWSTVLTKFVIPKFRINLSLVKELVLDGLPLGLASFFYLVYTHIDSLILAKMLGERSVGIYNAATPIAFSLIQLLNVPFVVAVYPALSRIHKENTHRFVPTIMKSLLFIALWSFPAAILITVLSPLVIPVVFGSKYDQAIPILRVLIYFVPFASLSALLYKILIIIQRQRVYLFLSIVGSLVNVLLNVIFIPHFSIMGAAYASVGTQIILFVLYALVVSFYVLKI